MIQRLEEEKYKKFDIIEREIAYFGKLIEQQRPARELLDTVTRELKVLEEELGAKNQQATSIMTEIREIGLSIDKTRFELDELLSQISYKKNEVLTNHFNSNQSRNNKPGA